MYYKLFIQDMRNNLSNAFITRKVQGNVKVKIRTIELCFITWTSRLNKSEKEKYKEDISTFQEDLKFILNEIYK